MILEEELNEGQEVVNTEEPAEEIKEAPMEVNQEVEPEVNLGRKRIVSTVIMGIILLALLTYTLIMLPVDLKATIDEIMQSAKESNSEDQGGAVIGGAIGALMAGLIVVLLHAGFIVSIIAGGIMIIFMIKNVKHAYLKPIKIINIVYLALTGFVIVTAIVKLIILFVSK